MAPRKTANSITDVRGILVGNAESRKAKSGVTAVICKKPATASCHVMGAAPGTRDTDLLSPENTVSEVDALFLSGGSAFGIDAGTGVQAWLKEQGRGFRVGSALVPIVPGAILFDLINGGDKEWGRYPPYRELGYKAAANAARDFSTGSAGAGTGALVAGLKGGLGSASARLGGITIGALVAVNAVGSPVMGRSGHFWAAPFEKHREFGGLGLPSPLPGDADDIRLKFRGDLKPGTATTIAVIATDAELTKAEAKRLAIAAHDGFARAIWPVHTPMDGDIVFSLATARAGKPEGIESWIDLCALASAVMARAIARAVFEATPAPGDLYQAWKQAYGHMLED